MMRAIFNRLFSKVSNQRGFSLVEATLSILLIGFTIMGGIFAIQNSMVGSVKSERYVIAEQLANEKLEMIVADKALLSGGYDDIIASNYPNETITQQGTDFIRRVTVKEVAESDLTTYQSGSGFKKVTVLVYWKENPLGTSKSDYKNVRTSTVLTKFVP